MDAHVEEYYDYQDAIEAADSAAQMAAAEGAWEDNGCSPDYYGSY